MHDRESQHGFMSPLALMFGLLVCIALGYALMRGFSEHDRESQARPNAPRASGEFLDAPLDDEAPPLINVPPTDIDEEALFNEPYEMPEALTEEIEPKVQPITIDQLMGEHLDISFAKLSGYRYIFPEVDDPANVPDQIPESIKKLNRKKIAVRGFMLPVRQKKGRVTEFLLLKDQSMCCFGTMPAMNEWIHVLIKPGESCRMVWDIPVTVFGTFEVGEVFENGVLMTIYRMQFEKLIVPEALK